jgi:hypothetical protein
VGVWVGGLFWSTPASQIRHNSLRGVVRGGYPVVQPSHKLEVVEIHT